MTATMAGQLSFDDADDISDVVEGLESEFEDEVDDEREAQDEGDVDPELSTVSTLIEVKVTRSARRKTTVGAKFVGGAVLLSVPTWMSAAEEQKWVEHFRAKALEMRTSSEVDLTSRAKSLSKRYELPLARSITFVDNMGSRWGSCTLSTGDIRISRALVKAPAWVLDYVIVHELAHLAHGDHGPEFWKLAYRYPRAERAIGFLHGWGLREEASDGIVPLGGSSDEVPNPEDVGVPRAAPPSRAATRPRSKGRKSARRRSSR
jgi:predicted metal-dependent hydrolase